MLDVLARTLIVAVVHDAVVRGRWLRRVSAIYHFIDVLLSIFFVLGLFFVLPLFLLRRLVGA